MWLLRFSVVSVVALIFLTGILFQQKNDIQMLWLLIFLLGSARHLLLEIIDVARASYWWFNTRRTLILVTIVTLWLAVAGVRDAVYLFCTLRSEKLNNLDDGMGYVGSPFLRRKGQHLYLPIS